MKWLKIAYSDDTKKSASIGVPLSSCVFLFDADLNGKISQAFVHDMPCRLLVDKDGQRHQIADWGCESLEELELQALLNGCLFGIDDKDKALWRAVADSMMARKLAAAEAEAKAHAAENRRLKDNAVNLHDELQAFWNMALHAYKAFCHHAVSPNMPDADKAAWQDTRAALATLANVDDDEEQFSYWVP